MASAVKSTVTTPFPYVVGRMMSLKSADGENISVTITNIYPVTGEYPVTPSTVMEVQIRKEKGFQKAILKLFDRRFGYWREREQRISASECPHTQQTEAAWQDYVRRGSAEVLFDCFSRIDEDEGAGKFRRLYNNDEKTEGERLAEREGSICYSNQITHAHEVQVYRELQALQGRCIPRFMASVTLDMPSTPPDLPPTYFEIRGILLQKVCGFKLEDLRSELPNSPLAWEEIIQNAVDAAKEINRAGVIQMNAGPWNVVVARLDEHTFQPFILDFAHSYIKWQCDEMVGRGDWDDKYGPDPYSFNDNVQTWHNPKCIGFIMVRDVEKATGHKLRINWDISDLTSDSGWILVSNYTLAGPDRNGRYIAMT
ncbi:hypothetical protein DL764_001806 [Monosporascus ibericus]|uniref:Protein kinase domain-containing protein n=1 Tax=Monosporascus ibericus TaxID=155417 RepID=A0A4Q4TMY9_9PEZI|nr:hypothetical protein DL764_001806 [Monosporascus ibericus]